MNITCEVTRQELLRLGWNRDERQNARRVLDHLYTCDDCRTAMDEFDSVHATLTAGREEAEPAGGWDAYDVRLATVAERAPARSTPWWRSKWTGRIAAALVLGLTAWNLVVMLRPANQHNSDPSSIPHEFVAEPPADISDATIAKAFVNVAREFDGKASWVMLSDHDSSLGLSESPKSTELLIVRLNLVRGTASISQINLAIIPGETARFTVPGKSGEQLSYVITTSARDPRHVTVHMSLGNSKSTDTAELGALATSLQLNFGQSTRTGQLLTRDGTYDLLMSLQRHNAETSGA